MLPGLFQPKPAPPEYVPEGMDPDKWVRGVWESVAGGDMSQQDALYLLYPTWAANNINNVAWSGRESNYSTERN